MEELLDTQTIDGCRIVFDYLDSRRERITSVSAVPDKHFIEMNSNSNMFQKLFDKKYLIILRSCNELLRRLSRAEDTVFCGRVFIFLFQSFPLGDKSSVNLRGEFHTDNVTVFEDFPSRAEGDVEDGMNIDTKEEDGKEDDGVAIADRAGPEPQAAEQFEAAPGQIIGPPKTVKPNSKVEKEDEKPQEEAPDTDTLYPVFWSLQQSFSDPTRLFDDSNLATLKYGLKCTMLKFKEVHQESPTRANIKVSDENRRGGKRKRNGQEDGLSASFNPKYLTSRDLFNLEISDLAFRRHILVQALILVDFLLSLTPKAKKKLGQTSNKSVLHAYTLSEENATWAHGMRNDIATYLQQGPEGKFYYRMVDTVVSRDKNWVHWKAEGCPPIQREPVSAADYTEAQRGVGKACANKRIRAIPMGTLDLSFLSDSGDINGMEKLKDPERYSIPTPESFQRPIADDDFEIEMAKTDEEKRLATDARASKLWRTLRIASKNKLNLFDKIDDGNNLKILFDVDGDENREKMDVNGTDENADQPVRGVEESAEQRVKDSKAVEEEPKASAEHGTGVNGAEISQKDGAK